MLPSPPSGHYYYPKVGNTETIDSSTKHIHWQYAAKAFIQPPAIFSRDNEQCHLDATLMWYGMLCSIISVLQTLTRKHV